MGLLLTLLFSSSLFSRDPLVLLGELEWYPVSNLYKLLEVTIMLCYLQFPDKTSFSWATRNQLRYPRGLLACFVTVSGLMPKLMRWKLQQFDGRFDDLTTVVLLVTWVFTWISF